MGIGNAKLVLCVKLQKSFTQLILLEPVCPSAALAYSGVVSYLLNYYNKLRD